MKRPLNWVPIWVDSWLFGSSRNELTLEQRAVWIDFLTLAGKDDGYIRASEGIPYPVEQLAGFLRIPEPILKTAIERLIETEKLELKPDQTFYIHNWETYKLTPRYRRMLDTPHKEDNSKVINYSRVKASTKGEDVSTKEENKTLTREIIEYFNKTTGQQRDPDCKETRTLIAERLNDGATLEDFKAIIDLKTRQWLGDPKMNAYLRPSTLFSESGFEDYLFETKNMEKFLKPKLGEPKLEDKSPIPYSLWKEVASIMIEEFAANQSDLMTFHEKVKDTFPGIKEKWEASSKTARELVQLVYGRGENEAR